MKKSNWKTFGLVGLVVLAMAGGGTWWWQQRAKADAVQYRTAKIERGNLQATVSASGAVNPVTQVSVGTQVSGQIKELFVDFNSEVKAGQLIAVIDPETFEYRVRSAQADVDAARAAVLTAQANIAASNAGVSRAQLDIDEARRDFERKQSLVEKQFIAQSEADKARALVNTTTEQLKAAQAQLGVTQAQIKSAQANVAQRESTLAQARIDLARTKITSPVNGIVIKRAIEKGQTVAASLQAPELFVIAQNLQDMQVDASIDESDVGRIRMGQKATFTVDAFPGQTFEGEVKQVRKAAQNVANVVTYVAVVAFTNNGGKLLPGMTANVRVVTDFREAVLKIPNAALRVKIAGVEPAQTGASAPMRGASAAAQGAAARRFGFSLFNQAYAQSGGAPGGGQGDGQSGDGGFAAQRERLVSDLQLNDEQKAKLVAIQTELRPQFMAMREMNDAQRAWAREKVTAQMRSKISAMLSPDQRTKYQELQAGTSRNRPPEQRHDAINSGAAYAGNTLPAAQKPDGNSIKMAASGATENPVTSAAKSATPAPGSGTSAALGAGPLVEFRNRLVSDLRLSADQQTKVDALIAQTRPRYGALRDLAPEERAKSRDRISADLRASVGDLLTAEQKEKYAVLQAETASRTNSRGRIYLLDMQGKPVAYDVRFGITDGTSTELMVLPNAPNADRLKEGANIVIGTSGGAVTSARQRPAGPRPPF